MPLEQPMGTLPAEQVSVDLVFLVLAQLLERSAPQNSVVGNVQPN